ncbi:hypothetical protein QA601_07195 [Chitinispirillales bacterium ANBcel5]|uniref:tetratricopeptide repeat protein n=1 Tax=Cellulosispirillum alkaliphilum TaxID=3039283 RepID=UPI002A51D989|nr:hypothetical protein [Chitinispirillales bacterium ANBcel5]
MEANQTYDKQGSLGEMVKRNSLIIVFLITFFLYAGNPVIKNGNFYFEKGSYTEALYFYNEYLQDYPDDAGAIFKKGKCLFFQEQYKSALDTFYLASRLNTNQNELTGIDYYIAKSLFESGEIDKQIMLIIDNSKDTILAESHYLVAKVMDRYFFADTKKNKYAYDDETIIENYKKVLEIFPLHEGAKKRIQEIVKGKRQPE